MYHLILVNEWCLFVLFVVWTVPAAFWSTFSEFWGQNAGALLHCVVDFWESNNRQTFHKHFSLLFGAFFNAMVICSMFDFYFGKKTGKIPKPNNSLKLGRLQNKNKAGSIFSLIMRFWAGLHTIFLFTLAWNVSIFSSCQCVWILDWIDFIHMG